ncbi:MAG: hypothetical protein LIP11_05315 [Clostridiales bacterium]|nr:hypothetical protein [Clostridiales bacterium]
MSGNRKEWEKKKQKVLPIDAKVYSVAIKIYEEQLQYNWDYTKNVILNTDSKLFHVLAIWHYKDLYAEEFWKTAYEKYHLHLILRCTDRKRRIRIASLLKQLGIYFRPGLDDELWKNHGVETVGNFAGYATYLTHETEDAIRDGKEKYEMDEIVSNLNYHEVIRAVTEVSKSS